jgi:hypothetical protein
MRIYYTEGQEPVVTETVAGLNALASRLSDFITSSKSELLLPAVTSESAAPYASLIHALLLIKREGPIMVTVEPALGLIVSGSPDNLALWCSHFRFPASASEGDHHHPEQKFKAVYLLPGSLSVIVEVRGA